MKLNKILMALSAMAIVGCSSEDFDVPSATQAIDDSRLIQLDENFVLAGVGEVDNTTRTHWEQNKETKAFVNKFLPIYLNGTPTPTISTGTPLDKLVDLEAQAVGLCWLGNGAAGTDVYTNYEFYHFGWLNQKETEAKVNCNILENGAFYSDLELTEAGVAGNEANETKFKYTTASEKTGTPSTALNFNTGVYKTDNKAIFGGKYIVYYPYNEDFKDAGTIPAVAETNWTNVSTSSNTKEIGHATFRYSAPVEIKGGDQAADFGLYNLSTLVQLRVALPAGATSTATYDKIVLYSPSKKLLKQANLAADKIAAGATGADLYAETEGTKTITATFGGTAPTLKATDKTESEKPVSAYITVLPTTVDDLVALVHSPSLKQWARVNIGTTVFKAGRAQVVNIPVTEDDFKTDFIAVDDASLKTALDEARAVPAAEANPQTITVIGDITLETVNNIAGTVDKYITITGDDIIVPEDKTLTLNTNMESNVRVLGRSCCSGDAGGILNIAGGTINNVTMEPTGVKIPDPDDNPTLNYTDAATVAAGKTIDVQAGNVNVNAAVAHKGNIKIAKGANVTVNGTGDLNFMGSTVTNNGTIEVMANGKFDMTNSQGNATADDGKRMTNNGTFIHNVDAGVGTAVQSMNQNGEYRCKVNDQIKLDDAFLQWTACSVIEMVNAGKKSYNLGTAAGIETPYQHNGKYIDIEVNSGDITTFDNPLDANKKADDNEIMIGNLTVKDGGLYIDYVIDNGLTKDDHYIYKRTLTVNGDMKVEANTKLLSSKKINVTNNVIVEGDGVKEASKVYLYYRGGKKNEDGFKVAGDITVSGATFKDGDIASTTSSDAVDALNITCANFYLKKIGKTGGVAEFANRTDGAAKNMVVSGTIDNPKDCKFNIREAGQYKNSVLAWVTCKELKVGGTFSAARPRVE